MSFVGRRGWKSLTVADALQQNRWTTYITGGLSVAAAWQCLQLWQLVMQVHLTPGQEDVHRGTPSASGALTTKSAYNHFFVGSTKFAPYRRIWKTKAPLKTKIFAWMAVLDRVWTAERLAQHGLSHHDRCVLCDQSLEGINHLLLACPFTRDIWFHCLQAVGLRDLAPRPQDLCFDHWWRRCAKRAGTERRRDLNSMILLVI